MLRPRIVRLEGTSVLRQIATHGEDTNRIINVSVPEFQGCFDSHVLSKLKERIDHSTYGRLTASEFKSLLREVTNDQSSAIEDQVYAKIDVTNVGYITFSSFASFLLAMEEGTQWAAAKNATKLVLRNDLIALPISSLGAVVHRDEITCLCYLPKCRMVVTGGADGQLLVWDPVNLSLLASLHHTDKHAVYRQVIRPQHPAMTHSSLLTRS